MSGFFVKGGEVLMAKRKAKPKKAKLSKCLDCGGKGFFDDGEVECLACNGKGKV